MQRRVVTAVASRLVIAVPYVWLLVFFLVPFVIVFKISLSQTAIAMPPYVPTLRSVRRYFGDSSTASRNFLDNYIWLTEDALYFNAYLSSLDHRRHLDHPDAADRLSRSPTAWRARRATLRPILLMLVILPFWTSFLIRVYAWIGILKPEGLLNQLLMALGIIDQPLIILNTTFGDLSSASSIPICPSWCCRSIRRWRRWTIR